MVDLSMTRPRSPSGRQAYTAVSCKVTRFTTLVANYLLLWLSCHLSVPEIHWYCLVMTKLLALLLMILLTWLMGTIVQCCLSSFSQYNSIGEGIGLLQQHLGADIRLQPFQELESSS